MVFGSLFLMQVRKALTVERMAASSEIGWCSRRFCSETFALLGLEDELDIVRYGRRMIQMDFEKATRQGYGDKERRFAQ